MRLTRQILVVLSTLVGAGALAWAEESNGREEQSAGVAPATDAVGSSAAASSAAASKEALTSASEVPGSQPSASDLPVTEPGVSPIPTPPGPHLAWDFWMPRGSLAAEDAESLPGFCTGRYAFPPLRVATSIDPAELPVEADAVSAEYLESGDITLTGDVVVRRGNSTLRAPELQLNHNTMIGRAGNGLLIEEPDIIFRGVSGELNLNTDAARVEDVEFLLPPSEMRGSAGAAERLEDRTLVISRGTFTRCEPGINSWGLSARSVKIEEGEIFGRAEGAVLRVRDVPVLYTPYLRFPVTDERQSGWLFPAFAYSDNGGFDLTLPYYLNLAPNYDATVMPRWVRDRGVGLESEFRYMSSWQQTALSGAFLYDDDLYDGTYEKDDWDDLFNQGLVTGDFNTENRWMYAMDHSGQIGRLRSVVDYTAVSDRDYFRNLGTTLNVSSQRELERRGELRYVTEGGVFLRFWAQRFDRLDEAVLDDYQRLPELALTYTGDLPGEFEWSVATSASRFDRDNDDLVGLPRVVGNRVHVDPRLRLPLVQPWGFLTMTGGYRYTQYDLDDTEGLFDDTPDRTIGLGSVDAGLFFEREFQWFGDDMVQTLEPRLFYLYQEREDQDALPRFESGNLTFSFNQLFRENRFAGLDRIGDANQLSVGLTSRLLSPRTGREYLRGSIGTIVYFEDREVTLSGSQSNKDRNDTSDVVGELSSRFGAWQVAGSFIWDPHDKDVDEGGGYIQYRTDNDHIINLGYRYRVSEQVNQTDASFIWPVSKHYSLIGRWNYDIDTGRTVEGLGGIEYNNCCWQIRVIARRFIDSPSAREIADTESEIGGFVQVVFKGLAGVGEKMESLLQKSIRGYRQE